MKMHELLSDASKWTKGASARNKHGVPVSSSAKDATCWCLIGAATKCYELKSAALDALQLIDTLLPKNEWGATWNDAPERTFEDVIRVLKLADV